MNIQTKKKNNIIARNLLEGKTCDNCHYKNQLISLGVYTDEYMNENNTCEMWIGAIDKDVKKILL